MVIVDTSIWLTHLRQGSRLIEKLLLDAEVMCHPFIVGELACGNLKNRTEIISLLQSLPMAPTIEFDEFLFFIERNHLYIEGYLNGLLFLLLDKKEKDEFKHPPLYYAFGTDIIPEFKDFKKIIKNLPKMHKASYVRTKKMVDKLSSNDDMVFHHPPWL